MITYLKGTLVENNGNALVIEVGGIGYQVHISGLTAEKLPGSGTEVKIHTYFQVREDAMQLFGFLTREDLAVFQLLIAVNGVGPKAALGILSTFTASDLQFAVLSEDAATISKAPGIGKKTAGKIILELKDKLKLEEVFEERLEQNAAAGEAAQADSAKGEAVQALVALGYSNAEALKALQRAEITSDMDAETMLKVSLKHLI